MYVCMYVHMYVRAYVCTYVCMSIYITITVFGFRPLGTPEVNDYPFTTRGVSIGHIIVDQSVSRDAVKFQVMVRLHV